MEQWGENDEDTDVFQWLMQTGHGTNDGFSAHTPQGHLAQHQQQHHPQHHHHQPRQHQQHHMMHGDPSHRGGYQHAPPQQRRPPMHHPPLDPLGQDLADTIGDIVPPNSGPLNLSEDIHDDPLGHSWPGEPQADPFPSHVAPPSHHNVLNDGPKSAASQSHQHDHGYIPHGNNNHYTAPGGTGFPSFTWADGLLDESPGILWDSTSPDVVPLTDDLGGAMDVVMGGGRSDQPGLAPAMHEFASEAASGARRRGTAYHQRSAAHGSGFGYGAHNAGVSARGISSMDSMHMDDPYGADEHTSDYASPAPVDRMASSSMLSDLNPVTPAYDASGISHAPHAPAAASSSPPSSVVPAMPPMPVAPQDSFADDLDLDDMSNDDDDMDLASNRGGSKRKKGPLDAPMSPRSRAQREKNREAVRNCRRRKREYTQKLKDRETMLLEENERLRLQLKLGSEEMQENMRAQCEKLVANMKTTLASPIAASSTTSSEELKQLTEGYMQTHVDQGRNREEASKHILSRLIRQVEPTHVTKMYLWQCAQDENYFLTPGGLWEELCNRLGLTRDQKTKLRTRRDHVINMCKDIASVLDKLENLHSLVMKKRRLSAETTLFRGLAKELTPAQLARFVVFVHNFNYKDPAYEESWSKYLQTFDPVLDQESLNKNGQWVVHNPGTERIIMDESFQHESKTSQDSSQGQAGSNDKKSSGLGGSSPIPDEELLRNRHKSAIVLKQLFERPEEELRGYADAALAPDLDLYDPNTVRVIHGIEKVLKYIRRIRTSFTGLTAKEENFMTRKNVARGRWTLTGTYYGLGRTSGPGILPFKEPTPEEEEAMKIEPNTQPSTDADEGDESQPTKKPRTESTKSGQAATIEVAERVSQKPEGKRVSFKVIIAYKFVPGSAQIQQLMVSWAALDVMRQLGLLPDSFSKTIGDRMLEKARLEAEQNAARPKAGDGATSNGQMGIGSVEHIKEETDATSPGQANSDADISSPGGPLSPTAALPPVPKLDQKLREKLCIEMTKIFELSSLDERIELADELLDENCVFQDANMGGAFHGIDECVNYVRRLRKAFSEMTLTRHNFVSLKKRKRGKKRVRGSSNSRSTGAAEPEKPSKDENEDTEPALSPRTQMGCVVKGKYTGMLVREPKPFEFNATIFVAFGERNKITEVEISWNATHILKQLGVLQ